MNGGVEGEIKGRWQNAVLFIMQEKCFTTSGQCVVFCGSDNT
jgi:hypothetical protein